MGYTVSLYLCKLNTNCQTKLLQTQFMFHSFHFLVLLVSFLVYWTKRGALLLLMHRFISFKTAFWWHFCIIVFISALHELSALQNDKSLCSRAQFNGQLSLAVFLFWKLCQKESLAFKSINAKCCKTIHPNQGWLTYLLLRDTLSVTAE